jgi:hypothetical protein
MGSHKASPLLCLTARSTPLNWEDVRRQARIGKELHEETLEVIQSFKRALDHRLKAIEELALPVERPVN